MVSCNFCLARNTSPIPTDVLGGIANSCADCRFQTEAPNVVHMTVKPQEVVDEEENAKTGKSSKTRDDGEEPTAGCRCVIL